MSSSKVTIIGAGVSGLAIAQTLSAFPVDLTLIEQNPYPGGRAAFYGCKATDSCVHCGVCLLREAVAQMPDGGRVRHLYSSAPVSAGHGTNGGYAIEVSGRPNRIDPELCTACGACLEACPEGAIEMVPGWRYFVGEKCTDCGKCVDVCPTSAIAMKRQPLHETIDSDAVVVSTGFTPFDPAIDRKWGYGDSPRVITSSDLERLLFEERYLPEGIKADEAKKVAFIQCVGSRNVLEGTDQCSRICCAYNLRMAGRLKDELPEADIDFYYMDIQHFGKGFPSFFEGVKEKLNLVRSLPISIEHDEGNRPILRFESIPEPGCADTPYDLVVLSQGLQPAANAIRIADQWGLDLDSNGFFRTTEADMPPGVFASGTCTGPMRIDECVENAASVSEGVLKYLGVST